MKSDNDLAFDRYASKICQALGVVATMVATKAMREPTDVYKRNLEKDEVAKAPIDLLFEMASFLEIGSFDEPPPFGLSIPPDELRYQSKVGRELIRSLAEGAELYFIGLDDSQVEIVTREYALEEEFYNLVGVAFGSLSEPSWIFWRPCDYNQTLEGWLVLPEIKNYSVIFRSPDREEPGNRDGCI